MATSGAISAPAHREFASYYTYTNPANMHSVEKPNVEESFDPEVVASVEAKLRALGVNDDPPTLEPESEPTSEPQAT